MTRPLSQEEKLRAFRKATCSMEGAADRWAQRAARGLTDDELTHALRYELGIYGGCSAYRDCPALTFQANGLKIWAAWEWPNHVKDKPLFQGRTTMDMARQVYGIRNPENKQLALF
ncbi:MAG TPA: hypothetical protein VE377_19235 [Candidatus Dormibacteraeota bacterium]|nr:hypothetical protein [Candidatus Dormibacteraeota bacterium]